jgi:septal ring factor EnvC (AmiA/AmiB activator)
MVQRDKQKLTTEFQTSLKQIKDLEGHIKVHKTEHDMQAKIIRNVSKDYEELKKLYSDMLNQRDILGTQLIRRNDELALLYEKIKILTG